MKKRFAVPLAAGCLLTAMAIPSYAAADYIFDGPPDYLFGRATSDETVYVTTDAPVNHDRSKNVALVPPKFGTPSANTLNTGVPLTPNLIPGNNAAIPGNGGTVPGDGSWIGGNSGGGTVIPPSIQPVLPGEEILPQTAYTPVTSQLYYSGGCLGTLRVPAIDLTVKVYQGTDSAALGKGAGHFDQTSIWDGNIAIAGHNRGVNNHFGRIHTLRLGNTIQLTTKLGTRTYEVYSVAKVSKYDLTVLDATSDNIITLVTCVRDEPDYRWCVQAKER